MTNPAVAIKNEVQQLIEVQIQTFKQPASLSASQLNEYQHRSKKIKVLYEELDRIGAHKVAGQWMQNAS